MSYRHQKELTETTPMNSCKDLKVEHDAPTNHSSKISDLTAVMQVWKCVFIWLVLQKIALCKKRVTL